MLCSDIVWESPVAGLPSPATPDRIEVEVRHPQPAHHMGTSSPAPIRLQVAVRLCSPSLENLGTNPVLQSLRVALLVLVERGPADPQDPTDLDGFQLASPDQLV